MLKRFSHFFACMLLVLVPLQGIAATNMSICNSLMQSIAQQVMQGMSCHDDTSSGAQLTEKHSGKHGEEDTCKTNCAALCASLNAMTVLTGMKSDTAFLISSQAVNLPQQVYVSITQPSLQRPPISFI
jgi:hypothetical protein